MGFGIGAANDACIAANKAHVLLTFTWTTHCCRSQGHWRPSNRRSTKRLNRRRSKYALLQSRASAGSSSFYWQAVS